jgi:cytochrome c
MDLDLSQTVVRKRVLKIAAFCATFLCQPYPSSAQNGSDGGKLFETTCTPCHNYEKGGEPDMYGQTLNLYGVIGRRAASVAGFEYSEDLRQSGIIWSEADIDRFITAPKKLFPGTRMELPGVEDERTRRGIIRFLGSLSQ